jgi:hypothetical protein
MSPFSVSPSGAGSDAVVSHAFWRTAAIRSQHLRVIDRTDDALAANPIYPSPEYVGGADLKAHQRPACIERTSFASDYVEQIVSLAACSRSCSIASAFALNSFS